MILGAGPTLPSICCLLVRHPAGRLVRISTRAAGARLPFAKLRPQRRGQACSRQTSMPWLQGRRPRRRTVAAAAAGALAPGDPQAALRGPAAAPPPLRTRRPSCGAILTDRDAVRGAMRGASSNDGERVQQHKASTDGR